MQKILSIVNTRAALGGLGKTRVYELIATGLLTKVVVGRRTFVTSASVKELIREGTVVLPVRSIEEPKTE